MYFVHLIGETVATKKPKKPTENKRLTPRQEEVLAIIKSRMSHTHVFPSLREIASLLGVTSKSGVASHIKALEKKGFLERQAPQTSGFALASKDSESVQQESFPLVATISAGSPQEVYEPETKPLQFSFDYFGGGVLKALKVEGQSMLGDAIDDGDIVIINTNVTRFNADNILAVRVMGGEFSLKRIRLKGDFVELIPSNPDFTITSFLKDEVEVVGAMVGLVRKF